MSDRKTREPLAEQLRPRSLDEVVGQEHLLGEGGFLRKVLDQGKPLSIILWGPPGSGKTSIAKLYSKELGMNFHALSAVFSGIADLRQIVKESEAQPLFNKGLVLFVDEIHRFNKAQQDAFLPLIEKGTLVLVGATTENPSFHLNNALLSRVRVLEVRALSPSALNLLLIRYEQAHGTLGLTEESRALLISLSQGDGRYLFNLVENLQGLSREILENPQKLGSFLQKRSALSDRAGDQHYNLISALHKAVRGSDPDAALYWFARMLEGGEEPLFIARRLIRMATEDIGLADPQALTLAIAARDAYEMLGSPEGELALAEMVVYLALAPKSNAIYIAYGQARQAAAETGHLAPPSIILNAPTSLMKELGYGKGYAYDHEAPEAFSGQHYFPEGLPRQEFYHPVERGFEREMQKRIRYFEQLRKRIRSNEEKP